jgi:hypothetical protein
VTYSVHYKSYNNVIITNETPFTLDIIERCEEPISIRLQEGTSLESQEYVVTGD